MNDFSFERVANSELSSLCPCFNVFRLFITVDDPFPYTDEIDPLTGRRKKKPGARGKGQKSSDGEFEYVSQIFTNSLK